VPLVTVNRLDPSYLHIPDSPESSAFGAGARGVERKALPGLAFAAGAAPGAAAGTEAGTALGAFAAPFFGPETIPIGAWLGGLIGGAVTGTPTAMATDYAQDRALEAMPTLAKALGQDEEQRKIDLTQHPLATKIGEALPTFAFARPSLEGFTTAQGIRTGLQNAIGQGGIDVAQQLAFNPNQPIDLGSVGESALLGFLGNKETGLGGKVRRLGERVLPPSMRTVEPTAAVPPADNDTSAPPATPAVSTSPQMELFNSDQAPIPTPPSEVERAARQSALAEQIEQLKQEHQEHVANHDDLPTTIQKEFEDSLSNPLWMQTLEEVHGSPEAARARAKELAEDMGKRSWSERENHRLDLEQRIADLQKEHAALSEPAPEAPEPPPTAPTINTAIPSAGVPPVRVSETSKNPEQPSQAGKFLQSQAEKPLSPTEAQQPTGQTYYVTQEGLDNLYTQNAHGTFRVKPVSDSHLGVEHIDGEGAGRVDPRSVTPTTTTPSEGLIPLTLRNDGMDIDVGRPMTSDDVAKHQGEQQQGGPQGDLFGNTPTASVVTDFTQGKILSMMRASAKGADGKLPPSNGPMLTIAHTLSKLLSVSEGTGSARDFIDQRVEALGKLEQKLAEDHENGVLDDQQYARKRAKIEAEMSALAAGNDVVEHFEGRVEDAARQELPGRAEAGKAAAKPGERIDTTEPAGNATEEQMRERNVQQTSEEAKAAEEQAKAEQETKDKADLEQARKDLAEQVKARDEAIANTDAKVKAAQEQKTAQAREKILDNILADETTRNPVGRFRAELRKAGYRDVALSHAETEKIAKFEELRDTLGQSKDIESSPNEMDVENLIPEKKAKGPAGEPPKQEEPRTPTNKTGEKFQLTNPREPTEADQAAIEAANARREAKEQQSEEPAGNSGQKEMFTRTGEPTKQAAGETRNQLVSEANRLLNSLKGDRAVAVMKRVVDSFMNKKATIEDVRKAYELVSKRQYKKAEDLAEKVNPTPKPRTTPVKRIGAGRVIENEPPAVTKKSETPPPKKEAASPKKEAAPPKDETPPKKEAAPPKKETPPPKNEKAETPAKSSVSTDEDVQPDDPALVEKLRPQLQNLLARLHKAGGVNTEDFTAMSESLERGELAGVMTKLKAIEARLQRVKPGATLDSVLPALRRTEEGEPSGGMSKEELENVVNEHTADWSNAPSINVVETTADLPKDVPSVTSDSAGLVDGKGNVYLVSSNISSPSEAKATIFHELLGHIGLRGKFGERLGTILDNIYKTNATVREMADHWIKTQFDSTDPNHEEVKRQYAPMSREQLQRRAVEEVLAEASEKGRVEEVPGLAGLMNRIGSVVRDFARRMGFKVGYSNEDVRQIMRQAHDYVINGGPAAGKSAPQEVALRRMIGDNTVEGKVRSLSDPENLRKTASDWWTNVTGATRRGFLNFMDQRWIADKFRKDLPQIDRWVDNLQTKAAYSNSLTQEAADVHGDWTKLPEDQQNEVGKLLLDASEKKTDVTEGDGDLQDRYKALPAAAKAVFDKVRGIYDKHFELARSTIEDFIRNSDAMSADEKDVAISQLNKQFRKSEGYFPFMRFGDFITVAESREYTALRKQAEAIEARIDATISLAGKRKLAEDLNGVQAEMKKLADKGERSVTAHETEAEMRNHANELREQGLEVREKMASDFNPRTDAVSATFMNKVNDALDTMANRNPDAKDGINGMKSMMNQLYFSMMPEGSAMKRQLQRKNVAGYSQDAIRSFAASTKRNASYIAELKHGNISRSILEEMRQTVKDKPLPVQEAYNQLKKHYGALNNFSRQPIQTFMNQATYAYMLGASPSFMAMHLLQTPLVTAPMLAGKHSIGKVTSALTKAGAEVSMNYKNGMHPGSETTFGKNDGEKSMIKYLLARNAISNTEADDFMAASRGASGVNKAGRSIMHVAGFLPHHTEKFNRMVTALAAHRLAMTDPEIANSISEKDYQQHLKDHPDLRMSKAELAAARYAEKITLDSHVDYSRENAPYVMQPGVVPGGKLIFQFQKYQFGMIKVLSQNYHAMMDKSLSAAERKVAMRTLLGIVGSHGLITGAMGLPGAGLVMFIANMYHKMFGDKNEPFDAETSFRQAVADALGKDAGDVVARGVLYAPGLRNLMPVDITNRVGMGDLLVSGGRVEKIDRNSLNAYLGSMVGGPSASLLGNMADAMKFAHQGDYWKASEQFMPKVLRDVSKAIRFSTQGVTTASGKMVIRPEDLTAQDIAAQMTGFESQRVEESYSQRNAFEQAQAELQDRRNVLLKQYAEAMISGDHNTAAEFNEKIQEYNKTQRQLHNWSEILTPASMQRAIAQRRMDLIRLRGGVSVKPKEREMLENYADFSSAATS
jgi:hypothetical protein